MFIYSPIDGHLGCVLLGTVIDKATMAIQVKFLCGQSIHFRKVGGKHFDKEWLGFFLLSC